MRTPSIPFDGLLLRGDRNPNTKGLQKVLNDQAINNTWADLKQKLESGAIKTLVVAAPEIPAVYPDLDEKLSLFSKAGNLIWLTAAKNESLEGLNTNVWQVPLKTFIEKSGTFVNFQGTEQKVNAITTIVDDALTLSEVAGFLKGTGVEVTDEAEMMTSLKSNYFTQKRGDL